ncbi:MAG: DUF5004 domain-containing protein [Flavobacteriales bacterium]|nr:DUF5004 domain-containing protein [Flavobacteriales bacterium]
MKYTLTLLALAILYAGCKPEIEGELGEPFDKLKGIAGTWKISQFSQLDVNNPVKEERDLSEFYVVDGVEPLTIEFNLAGMTYTAIDGPGKNYFGDAGTWGLDNVEYPSYLMLYSATDTLQFDLGSTVREFDTQMKLELSRDCDDGAGNITETVIYKFQFTRAN